MARAQPHILILLANVSNTSDKLRTGGTLSTYFDLRILLAREGFLPGGVFAKFFKDRALLNL